MAERRRLTEDEKREIEARVLAREQAAHPGAMIAVDVSDETGEDGEARIQIIRLDGLEPPPPPRSGST